MPYADGDGARIHYEVEGDGPPLVLLCSFPMSLEDWREVGYVDALAGTYRLLLIDPRGQGQSDAPHERAAYSAERRVGDVLAVLDAEEVERAHVWGWSMGARTAFHLGACAPGRARSLILGGGHPFTQPDQDQRRERAALLRQGVAAYVDWSERPLRGTGRQLREAFRARMLALDGEALAALLEADAALPSLEATLPGLSLPALVYCGDQDPSLALIRRAAALLPAATLVVLPGLGHVPTYQRPDLILPHVDAFLAGVAHAG
jgi:pimeloyl-ACP methyl ester carboxylesterase